MMPPWLLSDTYHFLAGQMNEIGIDARDFPPKLPP